MAVIVKMQMVIIKANNRSCTTCITWEEVFLESLCTLCTNVMFLYG